MRLVFLLEEPSMREALEGLLPRVLPDGVEPILVAHSGRTDLEQSIPRKVRAWPDPEVRFVVLRDRDAADCHQVKARLVELCSAAGRADALVRVVCRELESWFLGDLEAVSLAFDCPRVAGEQRKRKYRDPDALGNPVQELRRLVPEYSKISGARRIGPHLDPARNRSRSFQVFVAGLRRLAEAPP